MTRERSPSAVRVNAETVYSAGREADLVMTSTAEVRTSRHGPVRVSTVRESYWSFAPKEENILWDAVPGGQHDHRNRDSQPAAEPIQQR